MKLKKRMIFLIGILFLVSGCTTVESKKYDTTLESKEEEIITITKEFTDTFTSEPIPDEIYKKMIGKSIPKEDKINKDELSYLKISYYGFDGKDHIGEMIVSKDVAEEVLDIFKELHSKNYPIEKISLIDEYDGNDELSMSNNNTSAFCYRVVNGSDKLSNHAKGIAIDINPLINPMVKGNTISPKDGAKYINRDDVVKGMITKGDACYEAFTKRGWSWGGDWNSLKDYQHFEKNN